MFGMLVQSNLFQEEYDRLLKEPMLTGYGGIGFGLRLAISINRLLQGLEIGYM